MTFTEKVQWFVAQIPKGKVMSYKDVAFFCGSAGAARAVGSIMRKNYNPIVPCHRVIGAKGALGGYNRGGIPRKKELLKAEGIDLESWKDFIWKPDENTLAFLKTHTKIRR